jgi:hypothetical protein
MVRLGTVLAILSALAVLVALCHRKEHFTSGVQEARDLLGGLKELGQVLSGRAQAEGGDAAAGGDDDGDDDENHVHVEEEDEGPSADVSRESIETIVRLRRDRSPFYRQLLELARSDTGYNFSELARIVNGA